MFIRLAWMDMFEDGCTLRASVVLVRDVSWKLLRARLTFYAVSSRHNECVSSKW